MKSNERLLNSTGKSYLTGMEALVRLPIEQVRRDLCAGRNTLGFISGYQGSPLAGYDIQLQASSDSLEENGIHFAPGINEDLAATAVAGTQLLDTIESNAPSIAAYWYGKAPGLDRSIDAIRHGNHAGTSAGGSVVLFVGDDPGAKSSTLPSDSQLILQSIGIPVLSPGSVHEIIELGSAASSLSRYCGAWTSLKLVTDLCDSGGIVSFDTLTDSFNLPAGFSKKQRTLMMPPVSTGLEVEVNRNRLAAACEFARANSLNRLFGDWTEADIGIVAAGKTFYDTVQALMILGIEPNRFAAKRIRVAQIGMTFPLDPSFVRQFSSGLSTIVVVEEKRSFIESQLRDLLYGADSQPEILGKRSRSGATLFPEYGELTPDLIAAKLCEFIRGTSIKRSLATPASALKSLPVVSGRVPVYCSGCPHNRSTILLEGQLAGGGIGCHALGMHLSDAKRGYQFIQQMGGEGAGWIGAAPFVHRKHFIQNIGDGTYFHSGELAIKACIASKVNITFKILYNGTVAMTGGQRAVGAMPIPALTEKLRAEGVKRTVVLTREAKDWDGSAMANNVDVRPLTDLEMTLRELEAIEGVTVLIYDQPCASDLRRERTRLPELEPRERLYIHPQVCEGCGDCIRESNCTSLRPIGTDDGIKIAIHQSSCNKDYSCVLGDCPSFVTITLPKGIEPPLPALPLFDPGVLPIPEPAQIDPGGYRIALSGIGGEGVVSINQILARCAADEGLWVQTLDQTGLAQKNGGVISHLVVSKSPAVVSARASVGSVNLLLAFDLITASRQDVLQALDSTTTSAVINTTVTPTADSVRIGNWAPKPQLRPLLDHLSDRHLKLVEAGRLAEAMFSNHFAPNLFLLGVACQLGLLPIPLNAIERSMGGPASSLPFIWGRRYAHEPGIVESIAKSTLRPRAQRDAHAVLSEYQSESWANRYRKFLGTVDAQLKPVVGQVLLKLMTYKDEYEVARLLSGADWHKDLNAEWGKAKSVSYNLHPPFLRALGMRQKVRLGNWFRGPLKLLAAFKFLRGSPFDVFGYASLRREERRLIDWYRELVLDLSEYLGVAPLSDITEILALPLEIKGYEEVKVRAIRTVKESVESRLCSLRLSAAAHHLSNASHELEPSEHCEVLNS
jgi:indolepyruvate ferredoxin oxidoreductase